MRAVTTGEEEDQLALLPAPARVRAVARKAKPPKERKPVPPAEVDPVARVLVDVPLAHLDRPFDYAVPETMADDAQPGVRVKVRFAGQDVDGFVHRAGRDDRAHRPAQPLRRVVSAEPVLTPDVAALTGAVAARYAGTRSDVLRLAVPPRHADVEKRPRSPRPPVDASSRGPSWSRTTRTAPRCSTRWRAAESPRAVWTVLPGDDWADLLAEAVVATAAAGRGALSACPTTATSTGSTRR